MTVYTVCVYVLLGSVPFCTPPTFLHYRSSLPPPNSFVEMFRRLHSRIIGAGAVCGLPSTAPAEVFLKSLPPPEEVDPLKYRRFKEEEAQYRQSGGKPAASDPFFRFVSGAAGHKHCVLLTQEGNMVTFGDNRFGQTAGVKEGESSIGGGVHQGDQDWSPLYVDLAGIFKQDLALRTRATCGTNFTIVYQQGTRRAIAFGNNHLGQLGVGGKSAVDNTVGFQQWDPLASWWPSQDKSVVIEEVVTGYNHSVARLTDGSLYAFGSNTWGELGIGSTVSPMMASRISAFDHRPQRVRKVAAGNSFTLFLTEEGRVYGCGATNNGQLPPNSFEPVPIPLTRAFQVRHDGPATSDKLIRVKDIACVGSMSVFLSEKDEILIQGSFPQFGVTIPSPRFVAVDQTSVVEKFVALAGGAVQPSDFSVDRIVGGPSNLFVVYKNGFVAGMGANSEGQIYCERKTFKGKSVNVAPTHAVKELLPVLSPPLAGVPRKTPGLRPVWDSPFSWTTTSATTSPRRRGRSNCRRAKLTSESCRHVASV
ncbi:hypothetical protein AGDE_12155 [Angomonas deanei]|nr:hypothetical protein AGDE_12155 [Angomonas deanei]|eukprot:EPY24821.1 hypothetical protein AGDE_12155 [Angomonas deanei]